MDSLTQIVLGAATGEIILGRRIGNKALLLGAIGGTIPDLDVFSTFINDDPIRQLEVHRAYSHSAFTHLLLALPLAGISKYFDKKFISFKTWYLFWFMCLFTHALLDCCTTYGTRLLLPFTNYQVGFNNISVVDPLYTIPFLLILAVCLFYKKENPQRRKFLWASITVSSLYMLLTFGLKFSVHDKFRDSLSKNNIEYKELNSTPTILNAVLWSGIAFNDSMIHTAEYSFLKENESIKWISYKRNLEVMEEYDSPALETVKWFSDGNYFVEENPGDTLAFYNIKWGRTKFDTTDPENAFLFYFKFYKENNTIKYIEYRPTDLNIKESFSMLMKRIGI